MPNPADPQSLNRFSYVLNNPLKFIDPSGHSCANPESSYEGWGCWYLEQDMLNSTVMIRTKGYKFEWSENAAGTKTLKRSEVTGSGLGTIVDSNAIYTHDHSALLSGYTDVASQYVLTGIEILDANGKGLATLDRGSVDSYETPGLVGILTLKKGTTNLAPSAGTDDPNMLRAGDELAQVVRTRNGSGTTEVQWGEFVGWGEDNINIKTGDGLEPLNLVAFQTTVGLRGGDSGGGAFHNGRWVGANWGLPNYVGIPFPPLGTRPQ